MDTMCKHFSADAAMEALEVASGGGTHVTALAKQFPKMHWQPTDVETTYLARCAAHRA